MKTDLKRGRLAHLLAPRPGEVRGKKGNSIQVVALERKDSVIIFIQPVKTHSGVNTEPQPLQPSTKYTSK